MEQATLLAQLSREELYAIYQFLLLESRSPQEIPRNAQKDLMLDLLAQTLSLEEAEYCLEFFENYEFYEVPVLKWEMIDALPDDLLCALHSIYLDSIDFPETHKELVDSLSQSNYFLKEDARKFYLWFHYFRERILWEDTAPAQPGYNATVRYDLEEMGVAETFTMDNYGDLLAEDAGLESGPSGTQDYLEEVGHEGQSGVHEAHSGTFEGTSPNLHQTLDERHPIQPIDVQATVIGQAPPRFEPTPPAAPLPEHDGPTVLHQPTDVNEAPVIGKSEPELTPLQQKLVASLQAEQIPKKEVVNQTIEISSFDLEAYMVEQDEAEGSNKARPSLAELRDQITGQGNPTMVSGVPPVAPAAEQGSSVIVDIPSEVVDEPMIAKSREQTRPATAPPPPPAMPAGNVRSTMILDASAIIPDDMQELFNAAPGAAAERKSSPPPPPPRNPKISELKTIDIETAREQLAQEDPDEVIEELEPIEMLEEDELIEELPFASSDEIPSMGRSQPPQPPKPPPAPKKKRKAKPKPRVPTRTGASIEPELLEAVTTLLYRTALLGATYARPQIRAIRIYIQKVLECSPEQLRLVRDTLKRLQTEDFPLVPPSVEALGPLATIAPYAARLQLVHSAIFLLGCKTLQNLDRYRDFLIDLAVEIRLDPADISLFELFGIVEAEIQLGVKDCLELFGLEEGASEGSIRKAHRAKVRLYHPDQYHTKGPEFVRLAERKMKESNMALEILLHRSNM